jgi:uncharacterized protein (TIRG00374 family)
LGITEMQPSTKMAPVTLFRIAISLGLIGLLVYFADSRKMLEQLRDFRGKWAVVVFAAIFFSMLISTLKWAVLLEPSGTSVSKISLLRSYLIGLFFNNFLPSSIGGDAMRILVTGKQVGHSVAASSIVVERLLATVSLTSLGLGCALFARHYDAVAISLLSVVLSVGVVLLFALISGRIPHLLKDRNSRLHKAVTSFLEASQRYRNQPRALGKSVVLSLIFQIVVALIVGAVIAGLGLGVPAFPDLVYVTCAASVLAMAPAGINGYGLREGAFVYLLNPLGFAAPSAIAISVLFAVAVSLFSLSGALLWLISRSQRNPIAAGFVA